MVSIALNMRFPWYFERLTWVSKYHILSKSRPWSWPIQLELSFKLILSLRCCHYINTRALWHLINQIFHILCGREYCLLFLLRHILSVKILTQVLLKIELINTTVVTLFLKHIILGLWGKKLSITFVYAILI